jgi:hypothetical protein
MWLGLVPFNGWHQTLVTKLLARRHAVMPFGANLVHRTQGFEKRVPLTDRIAPRPIVVVDLSLSPAGR